MLEMITRQARERLWADFSDCLESEAAEEFLETLLSLMRIMFVLNLEYRRNIEGFRGRYQFISLDRRITMAALFDDGRMTVRETVIPDPDITITFRDGRTLINFILSPRQDIIGAMLRQDVRTEGNLNYLYKFGYMAKQLQMMMPRF